MPRDEFSTMLAIAHERLVMLDDLKAFNHSRVWLSGFGYGVLSGIAAAVVYWGLWRWL